MPADPRKLKPAQLLGIVNGTPLGPVLSPSQLKRHRAEAGLGFSSDGQSVNLLKYAAWLCARRHAQPAADPLAASLAERKAGLAAALKRERPGADPVQ